MDKIEQAEKLKRERIEVCLNCRLLAYCDEIGDWEECSHFVERKDKCWHIVQH